MSLQTRLTDWVTAVGTDVKAIRTSISGESSGGLTGLSTTAKTSLIAAINEVNGKAIPPPSAASETISGVAEIATQLETDAGTLDTHIVSPLKLQTRLVAYAQAKSTNLTALDIASTAYGRGFLSLVNQAGLMGLLSVASDTVLGISRNATQAEVNAGTLDTVAVTPLKFQTRLAAYAQPLSANLTSLDIASTAYGRGFLNLANQAGLMGLIRAASETLTGVLRTGTQAEHTTGTSDSVYTTPLKLQQKLTAWAQPLSSNLTSLSGVVSGAFGRTLLTSADAPAARTSLGLAAIAVSGSASDITGGTLPSSVMPPLAINETFVIATQAEMLALVAQRGDVAKRTDVNRTYILAADDATLLSNWVEITSSGDVLSVAGKTGAVTLVKGDVGLGNVDNVSDALKPVSTAQAAADDLRLLKTANLSDVANAGTALTNLGGISSAAIGNPETDLVATYTTAKA